MAGSFSKNVAFQHKMPISDIMWKRPLQSVRFHILMDIIDGWHTKNRLDNIVARKAKSTYFYLGPSLPLFTIFRTHCYGKRWHRRRQLCAHNSQPPQIIISRVLQVATGLRIAYRTELSFCSTWTECGCNVVLNDLMAISPLMVYHNKSDFSTSYDFVNAEVITDNDIVFIFALILSVK